MARPRQGALPGPCGGRGEEYIDSVNAAEATSDAEESIGMQSGVKRVGSGEVKVTAVEFLDATGAPGSLFLGDEAGTIRTHFEADTRVEQATFGFGIYNDAGICVMASTTGAGGTVDISPGNGHVDFEMPRILLK